MSDDTIRVTVELPALSQEQLSFLRWCDDPIRHPREHSGLRQYDPLWPMSDLDLIDKNGSPSRLGRAVLAHYEGGK